VSEIRDCEGTIPPRGDPPEERVVTSDIYGRLRERLDQYSVGFSTTESGVELRLLQKLFTEEEAEMYLHLSEDLQTAEDVAKRAKLDPEKTLRLLRQMTEKGLTFPRFPKREGEPFYFAAAPYVHGILENQLKRMDGELAELLEEHFRAGPITRGPLGLRTIPIDAAVDESLTVAPYDDVKEVLRRKDRIAIADCVCNTWQSARGERCDQPREVCILFDFYGEYYVDLGFGRWISQDEVLSRMDEAQQAGLVAQFSNSEDPEALCNCCPNCCGTLRGLKRLPFPGLVLPHNYHSQVDAEACNACEVCVDRCPMDAISMDAEAIAGIDLQRCIGCGLCVSSCPEQALHLEQRQEDSIAAPPRRGNFMRPSSEIEAGIVETG
jgi:Na+-translocating ferredoxin:NAD+ oxidoreductase RNF subunit RnfB